jgi:acyl-CoA thioesterase FadM
VEGTVNLFVRLLKVLLLLWWRPRKLGLHDESVLHLRVWPNDLDTNLHMNNGRYLTLLDIGRFDLLLRAGVFKRGMKSRWIPVLGATTVRFRRSLKLFETFTLRTQLIAWDDTWIYIRQTIESKGKLVTLAYIRGMFTSPEGRVPTREILKVMQAEEVKSPPLPEGLEKWLEAEEALYSQIMRDWKTSL